MMPRARVPSQADIKRAVAAVIAAGIKPGRIEIDGDRIIISNGDAPAPSPTSELDDELREFEARHGQG